MNKVVMNWDLLKLSNGCQGTHCTIFRFCIFDIFHKKNKEKKTFCEYFLKTKWKIILLIDYYESENKYCAETEICIFIFLKFLCG